MAYPRIIRPKGARELVQRRDQKTEIRGGLKSRKDSLVIDRMPKRLLQLEVSELHITHRFFALGLLLSLSVSAQPAALQDPLLDRMVGKWVLEGTIAGRNTTHDMVSEWVLGHQYLRMQEVSRERDARNQPAYEAIIFIGWDPQSSEYHCLWLDNTGPWDFTSQAIGRAKRSGDTITFRFGSNDGSSVKTTFSYNRNSDAWQWSIDNETGGKSQAFARVRLTRK